MRHLVDIAVRNLETNKVGCNETEESYREIDERGNILAPELRVHATRMTEDEPKAECA